MVAGALLVVGCSHAARADVQLDALFTNDMVLQRDKPLPIWGTAKSGENVTVQIGPQEQKTVAGADGAWRVTFQPLSATEKVPFKVTGQNALELSNVAVGDVYLCSGQSNMEFGVGMVTNAQQEIAAANYPNLRLMMVPHQVSGAPQENFSAPVSWKVCTPQNIAQGGWNGFSAVAYFFGRDLNQKLNVPIGLIESSWGGTIAQAWTSGDTLLKRDDLRDQTLRVKTIFASDTPEANKTYLDWLQGHDSATKENWSSPTFDDSAWKTIVAPGFWEQAGVGADNYDGLAWYRRSVEVPVAWAGKAVALHLGAIDDSDTTYFNGTAIGSTIADPQGWRVYTIPANLVKAGRAEIAVRVMDTGGAGGLGGGDALRLQLGDDPAQQVALGGEWRFRTSTPLGALQPLPPSRADMGSPNQPTVLYNGMIAPLQPFALKGAIWYQGESNADNPAQYRTLFPALIGDWRAHWNAKADGSDFPFYFVQLANFMARTGAPVEKGWAELRDAQANTLKVVPHTGMASAIDIGEGGDIHPKNKQDVGKRLALNALAKTYGRSVEYSGPTFGALKLDGATARVQLSHAQGLKTTDGAAPLGFAVQDASGKWFPADARIDGGAVALSSPDVAAPRAVRYAWANNPAVNLVNAAGLPANPFRTDTGDLSAPINAVAGVMPPIKPDKVDRSGPNAAQNLALGAAYTTSDPNSHSFGIGALTDGSWNEGGQAFATGESDVFPKTATVDLGKTATIGQVLLGVPNYGSTKTITVSVSADGKTFKDVGSHTFAQNKAERYLFNFVPTDARFVRLTYPDHYDQEAGYSNKFAFTSEVEVYPAGTLADAGAGALENAVQPTNVDRSGPHAAQNLALGKSYGTSDPNTHNFGIGALTDGSLNEGGQAFATGESDAFPKTVTIDLEKAASIGQISLGVPNYGSTKTITVAVSADGKTFKDVGSYAFSQNKAERHLFNFAAVNARYVRLSYPDHYDQPNGDYSPNFAFASEVEVYPAGTITQ